MSSVWTSRTAAWQTCCSTRSTTTRTIPPLRRYRVVVGPLRNIRTIRVTDAAILKAPMSPVTAQVGVPGGVTGSGKVLAVDHTAEPNLATFRFRLREMKMLAAEEPFDAAGHKFAAGTFLIEDSTARDRVSEAAQQLGVKVYALPQMPKVATHPLAAPRVALVHTWTDTQNEGWFRYAFDQLGIPFDYISGQKLRTIPNLRDRWDVILLGPTPDSPQDVVNGLPMRGDAIPWKKTDLTPNLGNSPDTTDDMRGGMGLEGLLAIRRFVEDGGLFVTIAGNASIPIDFGLIEAVSITPSRELKVRGSVVNAVFSDAKSPIAYGYGERLPVYFNQSPVFSVSRTGGLGFGGGGNETATRPSGRGGPNDPDVPQGRPFVPAPEKPAIKPGEEAPLDEETREFFKGYLPSRPSSRALCSGSRPRRRISWFRVCWPAAVSSSIGRRSWTFRWEKDTLSFSRTTRSGATRHRGATFSCSTRCSTGII